MWAEPLSGFTQDAKGRTQSVRKNAANIEHPKEREMWPVGWNGGRRRRVGVFGPAWALNTCGAPPNNATLDVTLTSRARRGR